MLFNSTEFLVFAPLCWVSYLALLPLGVRGQRLRSGLLLVASYLFYTCGAGRYALLLAATTAVDYVCARRIRAAHAAGLTRRARAWLCLSLASNLGALGFFKYGDFFPQTLASALGAAPAPLRFALPAGISFYTLQALGYTIDVYRGRQVPVRGLLRFAFFVSFFPQLVAGPIERAKTLLGQLERLRAPSAAQLHEGLWLLLWGFFKKLFVADNLAPYVSWGFGQDQARTALDVYLVGVSPPRSRRACGGSRRGGTAGAARARRRPVPAALLSGALFRPAPCAGRSLLFARAARRSGRRAAQARARAAAAALHRTATRPPGPGLDEQFRLWSYLHISVSFALSAAQPAWIASALRARAPFAAHALTRFVYRTTQAPHEG